MGTELDWKKAYSDINNKYVQAAAEVRELRKIVEKEVQKQQIISAFYEKIIRNMFLTYERVLNNYLKDHADFPKLKAQWQALIPVRTANAPKPVTQGQ